MELKGQGAIEYLLIIAATILVVALVILTVTGALGGGTDQTDISITQQQNAMTGLEIELELAKGHIQISSVDGENSTPSAGEWEDGQTYFISQDLESSTFGFINFNGTNNITLDCMGRKLTSTYGVDPSPIFALSSNNLTIKNCVIENQAYGFVLINPTNLTIENVTATNNTMSGGRIINGDATIKNSSFCSSTGDGLYCNGSTITVTNSKANSITCPLLSGSFDSCPS